MKSFENNSLSRERCVTVNEYRHYLFTISIATVKLFCSSFTLNYIMVHSVLIIFMPHHSIFLVVCSKTRYIIPTCTTGSTASRWDGFATTAKRIFLLVFLFNLSIYVPKWYFTSPDPSSAASNPANCVSI